MCLYVVKAIFLNFSPYLKDKSMIEAFHQSNNKSSAKNAKPASEKGVKRPIVGEETPKEKKAKGTSDSGVGTEIPYLNCI